MYGGPLPAIADRLFSIPASETERTIKIMRAVLGKQSCETSIATLIARVRLAMQSRQKHRAGRRDARLARAAGAPPQDVGAPRVAMRSMGTGSWGTRALRARRLEQTCPRVAVDAKMDLERWTTS
jgi:hypothetical protein